MHTTVEQNTTASTKDIADNLRSLTIPTKHELRIWAAGVIGPDLIKTICNALVHRRAIIGISRVVVQDVLIIAACEAVADSVDDGALTAGIRLVIPFREEDVDG